ncbi:hypothetical protein QWL27_07585 [Streptomyces thermocarboxydus]|uniref:Secreted protein n=2 Tax=Streptomyces TaxID=1883 RepID=S4V6P5_9ACTN|nr:hypothetical protein [Streptomyces lusitanus]MDN3285623.1 hypothetical protein [Streptomyces thermocarboxydus]
MTHRGNRATNPRRRTLRGAGALAGAALLLAGLHGPSGAAPAATVTGPDVPHTTEAPTTVDLVSTATGFTAPATARPGPTTFRASTTQSGKGWIGLARLKDGKDWDDFLDALSRALSDTPADVPQGAKDLDDTAVLLGGLVIHPGQPGTFTQDLRPGQYLLFDYLTAGDAEPRHRRLTVTGASAGRSPEPTATVVARHVPGVGPRFEVFGSLRAGRPLRYVNRIPGQVNELLFVKVAEGTTEAGLKAWFDALPDDGTFPPDSPFRSLSLGSLHLSTGRSSVVQVPLEPDRYAAITYSKDATDGIKLVKKGLFALVDVH